MVSSLFSYQTDNETSSESEDSSSESDYDSKRRKQHKKKKNKEQMFQIQAYQDLREEGNTAIPRV